MTEPQPTDPEELAAVAAAAEQIAADRPENEADPDWDATTWRRLEDSGLTLVAAPERLGGGGGTLRAAAEVLRVAGAHALRLPLAEAGLAAWLLEEAGLGVPHGVLTAALSVNEVRWSGGRPVGTARRIPYGRVADQLVLLSQGPDGSRVSVYDVLPHWLEVGASLAGDPLDALELDAATPVATAPVPVTVAAYEQRIALTRLVLTAGAAATVRDMTIRHVRERVQFGRPLAAFQAVQQQLAELAGEAVALQVGADAALLAVESGDPAAWMQVAAAKCDADRSVHRLTAIAHQLHGAIGATSEHPLRRYTLRLWSWREEGGSGRQWAERIAERVLEPEGPSLWAHIVGE